LKKNKHTKTETTKKRLKRRKYLCLLDHKSLKAASLFMDSSQAFTTGGMQFNYFNSLFVLNNFKSRLSLNFK